MRSKLAFLPSRRNLILSLVFLTGFSLFILNQNFANLPKIDLTESLLKSFDRSYTATISTQKSGSFFDPNVWGGRVPSSQDNVLIKPAHTIKIDQSQDITVRSIKNKGNLIYEPNILAKHQFSAFLNEGVWQIGTPENPFQGQLKITFEKSQIPQVLTKPAPTGVLNIGKLKWITNDPLGDSQLIPFHLRLKDGQLMNLKNSWSEISGLAISNQEELKKPEETNLRITELVSENSLYQAYSYKNWFAALNLGEKALITFYGGSLADSYIKNSLLGCININCVNLNQASQINLENNILWVKNSNGIVASTGKETKNRFFANSLLSDRSAKNVGFFYRNPDNVIRGNQIRGFGAAFVLDLVDNTKILPPEESVSSFNYSFNEFADNVASHNLVGFFLGTSDLDLPHYQLGSGKILRNLKADNNLVALETNLDAADFEPIDLKDNLIGVKTEGHFNHFGPGSITAPAVSEDNSNLYGFYGITLAGNANKFDGISFTNFNHRNSAALTFVQDNLIFIQPDNRLNNVTYYNSNEFYFPNLGSMNVIATDQGFASTNEPILTKLCEFKKEWNGSQCPGQPAKLHITNGNAQEMAVRRESNDVRITLSQNSFNKNNTFHFVAVTGETYVLESQNNSNLNIDYQGEATTYLKFKPNSLPTVTLSGENYAPYSDGVENWLYDENKNEVKLNLRDFGLYKIQS